MCPLVHLSRWLSGCEVHLAGRGPERQNATMDTRGKLGAAVACFAIALYFIVVEWRASQNQPAPAFAQSAVTQTIRADLMKIARAQQYYLAQENRFGTMDELISSGALTMKTPGRGVYLYTAEVTSNGFIVTARAKGEEAERWPVLHINERMEISEEPATAGRN